MLESVLNLFLASPCPLCDRPGKPTEASGLCQDCERQLQACAWPRPVGRSRSDLNANLHRATFRQATLRRPHQTQLPPVVSWGKYGGALKRAIACLKYEGQTQLAEPLGLALAQAWLTNRDRYSALSRLRPIVVPIPMHEAKLRQRGFNQAELIAKAFCRRLRLPLERSSLKRVRNTVPQYQLTPAERRQNLADALVWQPSARQRRSHQSRPILLLDDIYTSGATAAAAQSAIARAGGTVCGIVAVAQAGYKDVGPRESDSPNSQARFS